MRKRFVFDNYTLTALALRGRMPGRFFATSSTEPTRKLLTRARDPGGWVAGPRYRIPLHG
jgi:hypothetical protein